MSRASATHCGQAHPNAARNRRITLGLMTLALTAGGQAAFSQMMERLHAQAAAAAAPAAAAPAAAAAAVPNPDCTLIVPTDPLTAKGLATPYQLKATNPGNGACHEFNTAQSAFVQAAVIDPATGAISVYNPLVIDAGTTPAVAPVVPTLPANGVVAIWFGFNGTNLTLVSASNATNLANANCVNGLSAQNVFGQFADCNGAAFFKAADAAITSGKLKIPALGTAKDGQPCPTVRSFFVVDQDQSDNVTAKYLVTKNGKIAQDTQKNVAALKGATVLANPSDNGLVSFFMDPALGCTPLKAPDLADPGQMVPALPLDELQARLTQPAPVALIPTGDPMVLNNNNHSLHKTNLYREGVNQPTIDSGHDGSTHRYCRELLRGTPGRLFNSTTKNLLANFTSPDAGAANSLFTFLAQRFNATYTNLDCKNLIGEPDPITVTTNKAGVAVSATLNAKQLATSLHNISGFNQGDLEADSVARSQASSL
jgi:hypothetical protein